ncbi:MAG TPA: hypothetical protein VNJ08_10245 [Bacteriovoracaceae bacterium]|nr:hypothetical protein [Bacteriovoracaceae bacterium]
MIQLTFLFLLVGCNTKYDADACNVLSMKRYKGMPKSKNLFEENCKNFEIKYTAELCQEALVYLMKTSSLAETEKEFGGPIKHCFSESDLKRFSKE